MKKNSKLKIIKNLKELKSWQKNVVKNKSLGFVPTMGALHQGHMSLVKKSKLQNKVTLVSIFINPTQFNNNDDFAKYPQTIKEDIALLSDNGADAVFLPTKDMLYPDNFNFKIIEEVDSKILCGEHRPGHFTGMLTVVLKLLNLANAENAYFGEKDFQQLHLVKGMVAAFFLKTKIVPVPTLREKSGLALSSRNARLNTSEKSKASLINKLLRDPSLSTENIKKKLQSEGFEVDYVEKHWNRSFVAASIGNVRLIDNIKI